jgi:hypothetical protein
MTQAVREQFTEMTRRAFRQFINDRIQERLKTALATETTQATTEEQTTSAAEDANEPKIITTPEEWEAYYIIKAILRESVAAERIAIRDQVTYCGILLDDNNRKPVVRLWFNNSQKYISLFDNAERKETKVPIAKLDELYKLADRIKASAMTYLGTNSAQVVS